MWNLAHLHITINHVPVVLLPTALVFFAVATWRKSEPLLRAGIVVAWVAALFTIASYSTGDPAADLVMAVDPAQKTVLDPLVGEHDTAAGFALASALVVAAAGIWGWRRKGLGREVILPLLILSLWSTAVLFRTAQLGGRIRHPEARPGFVAPAEHEGPGQKHAD
ncbi:MAG TPA: hypothetical protein VMH40_11270 [Myxococcaceae bacterium]|nr:hypothetical protein [Myxococcaceae bacterium]